MNHTRIETIRTNNHRPEARQRLYEAMEAEEAEIWQTIEREGITNWVEIFQKRVNESPDAIVVKEVESGQSYTYRELDEASDSVCHFILAHSSTDRIGINYPNSFLFLSALIGVNKAGRLAVLFNHREPSARLVELAKRSGVKEVFGHAIEGREHWDIATVIKTDETLEKRFDVYPTTLEDPAFVIFTSGTSGPSKPALFSHRRMIGAGVAWSLRTAMDENDCCYIALPLFHGNGLAVAFSSVIFAKAHAVLRQKFSVSAFWEDVNRYGATHMVYIGELWRYLLNRDEGGDNPNHSLKVIFGNGLTKPLWEKVTARYGIEHVVEHFGATEMPAGALTNWFDIPGFCGYIPPQDERNKMMVLVDEEFHVVPDEVPGEALFKVESGHYRGYLDPSLDEAKLVRNLFEEGDLWWRSGDLLKRNSEGFYTFVDRLGDTYRYKGENVACSDVEEAIRQSGDFEEVVVYGMELPGIDGKIGVASLVPAQGWSSDELPTLLTRLRERLADHALPYFIRIGHEKHPTTSTLKIQKSKLVKEGLEGCYAHESYVLIEGVYRPMDEALYEALKNGTVVPSLKRIG
jgi:fatty-acyl-CoA synthase